MSEKKNEVATTTKKPGLIQVFGEKYNVEPSLVKQTLLNGAFKNVKQDHELIALLVIANTYDLNPFAMEMGGFAKDGVVYPMIFKQGWIRILLRQKSYKGKFYTESENKLKMEGSKPCAEWVECTITFNNGRDPETHRVYLVEWFRSTPTWKSMPYVMLSGKAMKECVREAYGINLYDEDDRDRILAEGGNDMVIEPGSRSAEKAKAALRPTKASLRRETASVAQEEAIAVDEETGEVLTEEFDVRNPDEAPIEDAEVVEEEADEPAPRATKQQVAAIKAAKRNNGWSDEAFGLLLAEYDAGDPAELSRDEALEVVRHLMAGEEALEQEEEEA